jgi:hypothetical protein
VDLGDVVLEPSITVARRPRVTNDQALRLGEIEPRVRDALDGFVRQ